MLDTANGNAGQFTESVVGVSESSGSKLVEYLQGQISSNAFSQELAEQITKIEKTGKSNAARMNSMHILKVEDHASGKKAIAGIAIGADAESDESQVIISANKFIIADPNSSTLKTPFSILTEDGSAKVVLDGDLIANGTISGDKIQANSTISAPNINGGNVKASTFEGGLIRGARIEGVTGTFTGDLEVNQIVGGNILEVFTCRSKRIGTVSAGSFGSNPRYYISYLRKRVRVLVESVNVDRDLFIIDALSSVSGRLYESTETRHRGGSDSDYITSITTYKPGTWNIQARIVIGDGVIDTYQQSISIPKNVECSIEITYETLSDTSTDSDSFTFISVVKSNASKSIKQVI